MRSIRLSYVVAAIAVSGFLAAPKSLPAQNKKIIFVAGPKDHGAPGRHEYEKDLRTLAYALEHSSNLKGITTEVIVGQVPRDLSKIKDAAAIVMESSSDRLPNETHSLFVTKTDGKTYSPEEMEFLKGFDDLVKKGMGLVLYHYATWIDNETGHAMLLRWFGGVRQAPQSTNPVDDWTNTPAPGAESHPILQGVKPWTYREEVFCKFLFPPDVKTVPLIIATPARSNVGPQVSAWAYDRPDGGRSVTIGGMDWHNLLQMEDNRKYMLNSIVWAAKAQVPAGGVQSTIPPDM
jgi:hypothetical protein